MCTVLTLYSKASWKNIAFFSKLFIYLFFELNVINISKYIVTPLNCILPNYNISSLNLFTLILITCQSTIRNHILFIFLNQTCLK